MNVPWREAEAWSDRGMGEADGGCCEECWQLAPSPARALPPRRSEAAEEECSWAAVRHLERNDRSDGTGVEPEAHQQLLVEGVAWGDPW